MFSYTCVLSFIALCIILDYSSQYCVYFWISMKVTCTLQRWPRLLNCMLRTQYVVCYNTIELCPSDQHYNCYLWHTCYSWLELVFAYAHIKEYITHAHFQSTFIQHMLTLKHLYILHMLIFKEYSFSTCSH